MAAHRQRGAPLVPVLDDRGGALSAGAPDAPQDGLEADTMLVGGPELHLPYLPLKRSHVTRATSPVGAADAQAAPKQEILDTSESR